MKELEKARDDADRDYDRVRSKYDAKKKEAEKFDKDCDKLEKLLEAEEKEHQKTKEKID